MRFYYLSVLVAAAGIVLMSAAGGAGFILWSFTP